MKLVPLKIGDRVRHYYTGHIGKVTSTDPLAVDWWTHTYSGYRRDELRKLPALKRCRCPDCHRSKGRKPCPLTTTQP